MRGLEIRDTPATGASQNSDFIGKLRLIMVNVPINHPKTHFVGKAHRLTVQSLGGNLSRLGSPWEIAYF